MRKVVEPKVTPDDGPIGGEVHTHPAFGQVTVNRVSGRRTLYGTDFVHGSYVRITVHESELHRSHARDWHFPRREVACFELSEAQWATFVSSFGVGEGTPCTLVYAEGERRPEFPLRDSGQEYKVEANQHLNEAVDVVRNLRKDVLENVQGLSKAKQAALLAQVDMAIRKLSSSLPYVIDSFAEHMENRVELAKVAVNAYVGGAIARAGLQHLGSTAILQIGSGGDKDVDDAEGRE